MRARGPVQRTEADREERRQREKKASEALSGAVPEYVFEGLLAARPSLQRMDKATVQGLACLCVLGHDRWRQHPAHPDFFSVRYLELQARFGRDKFRALNERHDVVEVVTAWDGDHTNAYRVQPDIQQEIDRRREALLAVPGATSRLIGPAGEVVKKLRKVPRTRLNGVAEGLLQPEHLRQITAVDLEALQALNRTLELADRSDQEERERVLEKLGLDPDFNIRSALMTLRGVVDAELTDVVGRGNIVHDYEVRSTGRLFAIGGGLQSAQRIIRRVALNGCYDYDFSNCHISILAQLGVERGLSCRAVDHYLQNKSLVRKGIAERTGLTLDQVKEAIIAVVYGAPASSSPKTELGRTLGKAAASRLIKDPAFSALKTDIRKLSRVISRSWEVRRGRIRNAVGLLRKVQADGNAKRKVAKETAHILQGIEAQALYAIIRAYSDDLVLLQHDGFTARRRRDPREMERIVYETTGYQLQLEEEFLSLPPGISLKNRNS